MTRHTTLAALGEFHRFGGRPVVAVIVFLIVPAVVVTLATFALITLWRHRPAPPAPGLGPSVSPMSGPWPSPYPPNMHAQGILDERFARGEIDADLYVRQSDLLRATRDGRAPSTYVPSPVSLPVVPEPETVPDAAAPTGVTSSVEDETDR